MSTGIQSTSAKRARYQLQARGRTLSVDQSILLARGLRTTEDFWFDVDLCAIHTRRDAEKAVEFFSASAEFEYRFVRGSRV